MATVQATMLKLQSIVDPYTKAGAEITAATIGTVDSDRFLKQRMLDIYNDARIALFQAMRSTFDQERLTKEISLAIVTTNIIFTATGDSWVYTLPAGYMRFISLSGRYLDGAVASTNLIPIILLDQTLLPIVREGTNPNFLQSATNRFVFEYAGSLYGVKAASSSTLLSNQVATGTASITGTTAVVGSSSAFTTQYSIGSSVTIGNETKIVATITSNTLMTVTVAFTATLSGENSYVTDYKLTYFGLPIYALSDVTGGSTTEAINVDYHPLLIELGVAIANGQGNQEVNSLAKKLLTMKG